MAIKPVARVLIVPSGCNLNALVIPAQRSCLPSVQRFPELTVDFAITALRVAVNAEHEASREHGGIAAPTRPKNTITGFMMSGFQYRQRRAGTRIDFAHKRQEAALTVRLQRRCALVTALILRCLCGVEPVCNGGTLRRDRP